MIRGQKFAQFVGKNARQLLSIPVRRKGLADIKHRLIAVRAAGRRAEYLCAHGVGKELPPGARDRISMVNMMLHLAPRVTLSNPENLARFRSDAWLLHKVHVDADAHAFMVG